MIRMIILGSSSAVPDESHLNTHLVVVAQKRMVMIDCSGTPILRLKEAGLDYRRLTDVLITHFHPDHVSGVPQFLMNLWLLGRKDPLHLYGLDHAIERTKKLLDLFDWQTWPGFYPVVFHRLPEEEMNFLLETEEMRIFSSPVRHIIPTVGLRIESVLTGGSIAYSSDTEPCSQVVGLANKSDVLIHEATGAGFGHSSAEQAGEIAQQAEAARLVLIHYDAIKQNDSALLVDEARSRFHGPVELASDLMQIEF
jgi:ribonuclease Z